MWFVLLTQLSRLDGSNFIRESLFFSSISNLFAVDLQILTMPSWTPFLTRPLLEFFSGKKEKENNTRSPIATICHTQFLCQYLKQFLCQIFCLVPLCLSCDMCPDELEAAAKGGEAGRTCTILYASTQYYYYTSSIPSSIVLVYH